MSYNEPPNYGAPPPPPGGYGGGGDQGGYGGGGYGGGGYGGPGQGGYGGQPQSQSVMSIISLVTGILGIPCCGCFVFSAAAIVLGILGRKEIAESNGAKTGDGLAKAGLILGIVGVVLGILYWILYIAGVTALDYSTYD